MIKRRIQPLLKQNFDITGIVTAISFTSKSDINLKTDIVPIENPIDKIIKINGVSFNWKNTAVKELKKEIEELKNN